jgi:hypothetical protein
MLGGENNKENNVKLPKINDSRPAMQRYASAILGGVPTPKNNPIYP